MRWDAMRVAGGGPGPPALFERDAVARTFDTPGFRGMTFFEVHARSVINRVPEASRLPFRWTINPYRGCSHACSYCISGETPILMADGRTRPLADVRPGDAIYGTVRVGHYRVYVPTRVRAWWQTVKPAYLTTLEDDTTLVTSGDHRFLTDRGWKYVTGAMCGPLQRPYLTTGNKLMGVGAFADQPKASGDYRHGYLCGMVRGDGSLGVYSYRHGEIHQFRLALADTEALDRARDYLASMAVATATFTFAEASETRRQMMAIRTGARDQVRFIQWLTRWPTSPSLDWQKGFLAGIFDAEGSYSRGALRISNTDRAIIGWTIACMYALGFKVVVEPASAIRTACGSSGCAAGCGRRSGSSTPPTRRSPASARSRAWRSRATRRWAWRRWSRSGWTCPCTTSPPGPATSSPTAW